MARRWQDQAEDNDAQSILLSFNVYRDAHSDMFGIDLFLSNIIHYVIPNSPAQIAGLQKGDRIIAINGIEVRASAEPAYFRMISHVKGRDFLRVAVFRKLSSPPMDATEVMSLLPCYEIDKNGARTKKVVLSSGFGGTPRLPSYSRATNSTDATNTSQCYI